MRGPVVIVPYDPIWPDVFGRIRAKLISALGPLARDILHIGSTSVPGLAAKPVIDIDVVISTEDDLARVISKLCEIGYAYEGDLGIKGRHAFVQPADLPPHHLYVCAADSLELKHHIAFRDYLRTNPAAVLEYAAIKMNLAEQFGADREGYTTAKSAFIKEALSNLWRES